MTSSTDRSGGSGRPPERVEFALDLPSDLDMIESTVAYLAGRCRAFAFNGSRLNLNFRVGVTEALSNAILYGNESDPAKRVRLNVSLDPTRIVLIVVDEGPGFDPESLPDPTLPENIQRTRGRGVFMLRTLMDEVEFNERGNAVRLVLYRDGPARGRLGS